MENALNWIENALNWMEPLFAAIGCLLLGKKILSITSRHSKSITKTINSHIQKTKEIQDVIKGDEK